MTARRGVVLALFLAVLLSGCSAVPPDEIDGLRERFLAAGGTCSAWSAATEPGALAAQTCDEGALLVVFADTADRADFIKSELETNALIRGRTHVILSTDTWLVLDTLAAVVRVIPAIGGMISGRNGANP